MKKFAKIEAFTGLEAAIVLIAFVVVAAVFSYVVLGAGFFTTQKAQQVVYSGVQQASSNLVIIGETYGDATGTPNEIHAIIFTIGLAAGGTPIDLNKTVFVYQNKTTLNTLDFAPNIMGNGGNQPADWQWMVKSAQNDADFAAGDTLLKPNEQFTIQVNLSVTAGQGLPSSESFTLQIKPDVGAALPIHKTAPGGITNMNLLY
jgi:flagellin FlaB